MSSFAPLLKQSYLPGGYCYLWQPGVLWMQVVADMAIGIAFFCSALLLLVLLRRRRISLWIPGALGLFCLLSGLTHFFSVLDVWVPVYRLSGIVKVAAACASLATVVLLFPILPRLLDAIERLDDGEEDEEGVDA